VAVPDAGGGDEPDAGGHVDPPDAGGGGGEPVTITHSTTMALEAETGITCQSGFGNVKNSWYRVFDLPAMGITGALDVNQMTIGIQEAASGNGNGQPLTVKLHRLNGAFTVANLTELGNAKITVPDTALQIFDIPITASVPAGITLVAEMTIPNGEARGNSLFPGANNDGQSGPTYVKSECGGPQPEDAAGIGFPDFHLVLSVDAIEQ
ncbi:MAG TPA: hypothetical protein VIG06_28745, partial [Kofleriaceae bacterium]